MIAARLQSATNARERPLDTVRVDRIFPALGTDSSCGTRRVDADDGHSPSSGTVSVARAGQLGSGPGSIGWPGRVAVIVSETSCSGVGPEPSGTVRAM